MAESMKGLKRSHRCAELSLQNVGEEVTVMGWVQKQRNKGGIIFVDLRDRTGILQIIFEEADCGAEAFAKAEKMRSEFVIAVVGKVEKRSGAVNENLKTGEIEIRAAQVRVLSESETPPFPVEADSKTKEEIRLKYRYLDLRRPDIQEKLMLRSKIVSEMRDFMAKEGFLEIETPILCKSTPEGARDYLVQFLCAAPVAAALQAASDVLRVRSVFPDCEMFPGRGSAGGQAAGVYPSGHGVVFCGCG